MPNVFSKIDSQCGSIRTPRRLKNFVSQRPVKPSCTAYEPLCYNQYRHEKKFCAGALETTRTPQACYPGPQIAGMKGDSLR